MAYEVVMPYHLHMPSYFLETFTEYPCLFTITQATRFQLLEEIVTLIIYQDECREVFHFNLPDSLHTQFRIFSKCL